MVPNVINGQPPILCHREHSSLFLWQQDKLVKLSEAASVLEAFVMARPLLLGILLRPAGDERLVMFRQSARRFSVGLESTRPGKPGNLHRRSQ